MFPFASTDRYDPDEAPEHAWCMLVAHRKFFLAVQTQARLQSNPFFEKHQIV